MRSSGYRATSLFNTNVVSSCPCPCARVARCGLCVACACCSDAEVLSLMAAIINKLRNLMEPEVPRVFEAVFEVTLTMITRNFEDYPEHRLQFFNLLHAIVNNCFRCMFLMSPQQLKLVIDSIIWAFRHTERNVAETGLQLLHVSGACGAEHERYMQWPVSVRVWGWAWRHVWGCATVSTKSIQLGNKGHVIC